MFLHAVLRPGRSRRRRRWTNFRGRHQVLRNPRRRRPPSPKKLSSAENPARLVGTALAATTPSQVGPTKCCPNSQSPSATRRTSNLFARQLQSWVIKSPRRSRKLVSHVERDPGSAAPSPDSGGARFAENPAPLVGTALVVTTPSHVGPTKCCPNFQYAPGAGVNCRGRTDCHGRSGDGTPTILS